MDENEKKERKTPSLKNLDTGALRTRIEAAQDNTGERENGIEPKEPKAANAGEIRRTVRRVAGRQIWIICACVLLVLAAAAVLTLQFGNLFAGGKDTERTASLTAKDAPWLSFADGMLAYNSAYTGNLPAELVIPDTFDGKAVVGVADEGFAHIEEITSVTVGKKVTQIGVHAFEGCTGLSLLHLGGVKEISQGAFDGCISLTTVTEGNLTSIGAYAFHGCTALSAFPLGDAVTAIGNCAFQDCSTLGPQLLFPASVSKIGQNAYAGCTSLMQIIIPDADSIGAGAFLNCTGLTSAQINCLNVESRALADCTALERAAFGGKTLSLGKELFDGCTALTEVTYENEGTTLAEGTFQGCTALTVPPLPAGITAIPARTFAGCIHLADTGLSPRILSIGTGAYENCTALTQVHLSNNIDTLGEGVFSGCTHLSQYTLPRGITEIPPHFFSGCSSLRDAQIPEGVEHIGESAFQDCTGLLAASIPYGVLSLEESAFAGCTALEKITLPTSLTSIGENAFAGCTSIKNLDIPKSVTWIGDRAFADMENLQSLGLFAAAQVSAAKFPGCSALSQIRISGYDSLYTVIGGVLFSADRKTLVFYPVGLQNQNYTVPAQVEQIETGAFQGAKLRSVHTGSATFIGMYAFADCEMLQSVTLGEGLAELGYGAFQNCTALESVQLPSSLTALDSMVFAGCTSLAKLALPQTLVHISADAVEKTTTLFVEENAPIIDALEEMDFPYEIVQEST